MSVFREDPYPGFNFLVELPVLEADGGEVRAGFAEISGLEIEQQMISYRNGNEKRLTPRQMPGLVSYAPVVLKRGVTGDTALWAWMQRCNSGDYQRADVTIKLLDEQREVVMVWKVRNALPSRLSGPVMRANASEIAIETLEICHDGLSLDD